MAHLLKMVREREHGTGLGVQLNLLNAQTARVPR